MEKFLLKLLIGGVLGTLGLDRQSLRQRAQRQRSGNEPEPEPVPPPAPRTSRPAEPPAIPEGGWREQLDGAWLTCTGDGATLELWPGSGPKRELPGGFNDAGTLGTALVLIWPGGASVRTNVGLELAEELAGALKARFVLPREVPVEKVAFPEFEADPHPWNGRVVRVRGQVTVAGELQTFAGLWLTDACKVLPEDLSPHLELVGLVRHSRTVRRFGPSGFYQGELVDFSAKHLREH
jgi:hypothetical protein